METVTEAPRANRSPNQTDQRGNTGNILTAMFNGPNALSIISFGFSILALAISVACVMFLANGTFRAQLEAAEIRAQASRDLGTEKRLNTQAIDELKLETRQALKRAGVDVRAGDTHESK